MNERDLLCSDCGHHLHRPTPGPCQWRGCSCWPSDGPVEEPRPHNPIVNAGVCTGCSCGWRNRNGASWVFHANRAEAAHPATEGTWAEGFSAGIREKRAPVPATEGLDVERLASVLRITGTCWTADTKVGREGLPLVMANRIAAEYASLSSPEGQEK